MGRKLAVLCSMILGLVLGLLSVPYEPKTSPSSLVSEEGTLSGLISVESYLIVDEIDDIIDTKSVVRVKCTMARRYEVSYGENGEEIIDAWDTVTYGTAWPIDENTFVTAFHVVDQGDCVIGKDQTPLAVTHADPENDFALFEASTDGLTLLEYSCDGYTAPDMHFAIGYPSRALTVTTLLATDTRFNVNTLKRNPNSTDYQMHNTRRLVGMTFSGMSGGPVVDINGTVVGINSATQKPEPYSLSRELKDTILCEG